MGEGHLQGLVFPFNAGNQFSLEKVAYIFARQRYILLILPFVVLFLYILQQIGFRPFEFRIGKAETLDLLGFKRQCIQSGLLLPVFRDSYQVEGVFRFDQVAVASETCDKRSVGLLRNFRETVVDHERDQIVSRVEKVSIDRFLHVVRKRIFLILQRHLCNTCLRVGNKRDDRFVIVRNLINRAFAGIFFFRNIAEQCL